MSYIYNNYLYDNIFELIDSNFPENTITTVGSMKEDEINLYIPEVLSIIEDLDDDIFFDTKINKPYSKEEFYNLFNIREATADDFKLIYGF